ncbi:MAG: DUF975 family protein [Clostridiales bacterium]|nr:DUF975 family protein [Clostridiales bacterium]
MGYCRVLLETRGDKKDFGNLFWAFREGRYRKVMKTMFFYDLKIFLWSLLFIIPGIVKSYEYYYVPYLLAENPDLETKRVFELTKRMTDGEKGEIFVLGWSFFGWIVLGLLACCIGIFFLSPYIAATNAELYAHVRARSLVNGLAGAEELPGV